MRCLPSELSLFSAAQERLKEKYHKYIAAADVVAVVVAAVVAAAVAAVAAAGICVDDPERHVTVIAEGS